MDKKKDIYNLWVQYTTKVSSSSIVDPSDIPRIVAEQIVCVFLRSAIRIIADKRNTRGIEKRNWDPPVKIDKVSHQSPSSPVYCVYISKYTATFPQVLLIVNDRPQKKT